MHPIVPLRRSCITTAISAGDHDLIALSTKSTKSPAALALQYLPESLNKIHSSIIKKPHSRNDKNYDH